MPNTLTNQNRNRGTSKSSAPRLKSRNSLDNCVSSPKLEKISKYFQTLPKEDSIGGCSNQSNESPYKNCLTEIKSPVQNDSLADFKATEPCKVSKLVETKLKKEPTRKRKKYKQTKLQLQEFTDTNPDHLQLALALSESSYTAETSSQSNDSTSSTSQERIEAFKKALEKFGFSSTRTKKSAEIKQTIEVKKLSKKSRYRYVTPVLFIRTEEERQARISTRINEIVTNRAIDNLNYRLDKIELSSEKLQEIHNKKCKYFRLNSLNLQELKLEEFYTNGLDLSPKKGQWGSLLKNWRDIAGRDRSPSPVTISENIDRSLSPDLFEFDSTKDGEDSTQIEEFIEKHEQNRLNLENIEEKVDLTQELLEEQQNESNSHNFTCISDSILSIEGDGVNDKNLIEDLDVPEYVNQILTQDRNVENEKFDGNATESIREQNPIVNVSNRLDLPQNIEDKVDLTQDDELLEEQDYNCNNSRNVTCISDSILSIEGDKVNDKNLTEDLNITDYVNQILTQNKSDKVDLTEETEENLTNSQESIVISDDELNYSSVYSTPFKKQDEQILNDLKAKYDDKQPNSHSNSNLLNDSLNDVLINVSLPESLKENQIAQTTPIRDSVQNDCVIKTENITPMADYDRMNTPKIVDELQKFGLKPLKRQRGVQMLKYIYESTHPVVDSNNSSDDDLENCSKRRRIHFDELQQTQIVGDIVTQSEFENDELIFERNRSKKIATCPIPLQIVWFNFLVNNPQIRRNILLYEPLQLEVLHAMLKQQGFKFHIQDLVTFLDRKCITIRTNQSNHKK